MRDCARPGLRGRREGESEGKDTAWGSLTERRLRGGGPARDDLLIVSGLAAFLIVVAKLQDSVSFSLLCSFRKLGACPFICF